MSTAIANPDDGDRIKRLADVELAKGKSARTALTNGHREAQLPLFKAAVETEFVQNVLELLSALWAKILELEKKILESFDRMAGVEQQRVALEAPIAVKEFYTTEEFARIFGLQPATVQTYLRLGKLNGTKTVVGRGSTGEWRISHAERLRYEADGLLREDPFRRRLR